MISSIIIEIVKKLSKNSDVLVLKGFPFEIMSQLNSDFPILDINIYENGKINLQKINFLNLFLVVNQSKCQSIICYESFLDMTNNLKNLQSFNKTFCVINNNLLDRFYNPTINSIPDFDSNSFSENCGHEEFAPYYSYCQHEKGNEYVQYIHADIANEKCVKQIDLISPKDLDFQYLPLEDAKHLVFLSVEDGSLNSLFEDILFTDKIISQNVYTISQSEIHSDKWKILNHLFLLINKKLELIVLEDNLKIEVRPEISSILNSIWGYPSFRSLKVYKNLYENHDITEISQGEIIETVIRQCELAYEEDYTKMRNILLTSPTGAGKSLLFQLSAIYIAQKYGLLTIVISPLLALMDDQVKGLSGNYTAVATLNSNKSASEKERIINGVKSGEINLLYLSPELLLSYVITTFIGERKIGLVVIDEAHTVTTWGRDFRIDYWFLGDYLRKAKKTLGRSFPIFALTATAVWDISGKNDMVFDTIRSLNMSPCLNYIGVVRRNNIIFDITQSNIVKNYEEKRLQLTLKRIKEFVESGSKTIVYFPYKKTIYSLEKSEDFQEVQNKVTEYHSWLTPAEKKKNADDFKLGDKTIMCATKAFGMGVDVSDIQIVYHHAPSGGLSDYVQEIGRLARDPKITGIAKIDFSLSDYRYRNTLYWLSSIKLFQLKSVLKKLMALYRMNGEKRNMLISASDFEYIFPKSKTSSDYDKNLKSCLMLISNDLHNKLGFNSLIVRPKSLFSKIYIKSIDGLHDEFYRNYHQYLRHLDKSDKSIFVLDGESIWNDKFNNYSFADFKRRLIENKIFQDYKLEIINKIDIECKGSLDSTACDLRDFFKYSNDCLNYMSTSHHRLSKSVINNLLRGKLTEDQENIFWEAFKLVFTFNHGSEKDPIIYCSVKTKQTHEELQLERQGYEREEGVYFDAFKQYITAKKVTLYSNTNSEFVRLAELMNILELADYQRLGGDSAIFVRINNPFYLNNLVRTNLYKNDILNDIHNKFNFSEKIFTYFFTSKMSNERRWDFIEAYFLGASESELLSFK